MDKEVLSQYRNMIGEIKDIRKRIAKTEKEISRIRKEIVADTVKGTRKDGTYGPIKITGIQTEKCYQKQIALERYRGILEKKETELVELTCQAEEYIQSIDQSELRTMFRYYYIDGLPWWRVAQEMNRIYKKRRNCFTEDGCRMRDKRFFEKK